LKKKHRPILLVLSWGSTQAGESCLGGGKKTFSVCLDNNRPPHPLGRALDRDQTTWHRWKDRLGTFLFFPGHVYASEGAVVVVTIFPCLREKLITGCESGRGLVTLVCFIPLGGGGETDVFIERGRGCRADLLVSYDLFWGLTVVLRNQAGEGRSRHLSGKERPINLFIPFFPKSSGCLTSGSSGRGRRRCVEGL